jgi:hypothetical protein
VFLVSCLVSDILILGANLIGLNIGVHKEAAEHCT